MASTATPGLDSPAAAADAPARPPPRAWLHHDIHAALLKLQGRAPTVIEATPLLDAVRAVADEDSEPISEEEWQEAIETLGERGWVVVSAAEAAEAMAVAAALAALRARGWLVGASQEECIASLETQALVTQTSAEEAAAAVRTLCASGCCFLRDSTPLEWDRFVFELRRREQDKAVGLLTAELDNVDGWRARLEEMEKRGGSVGERVKKRTERPQYGRPEVDLEWPRALLDAPCAWGKTVGSIKVAVNLFRKHADLGTVAVFEHRLDLIKQVMEEWAKWAQILHVELQMFTVCSLSLAGAGDEAGPRPAKLAKVGATGASAAASSSSDGGGTAAEDADEEEAEAEGDEQSARADLGAAEKERGAIRLQDADAVNRTLLQPPPEGKLRVLFVCYDSTVVLCNAYDRYRGKAQVPEPLGLAIFDEAHEMAASGVDSKERSLALYDTNVPIRKRLFMTATPKVAMVKQGSASGSGGADEEGETLALSMGEEEVYGSERHLDIVRGRSYSMRFDEAIKRGLITDYKLLVISMDGKRDVIEELAAARLSTNGDSFLAKQLREWKQRHAKPHPTEKDVTVEPEVDALEVAKVKALEDALINHGLHKVFVFSSLKQWAELFGILALELIVDKSKRETASDAVEAAPPPLLPKKVHVVHSSASYRVHEGFKAKRDGEGCEAVKEFGDSLSPAVLSNVRSLGTGTDCPRADGTMFGTSRANSIGAV